jgi:hypothetical protein
MCFSERGQILCAVALSRITNVVRGLLYTYSYRVRTFQMFVKRGRVASNYETQTRVVVVLGVQK